MLLERGHLAAATPIGLRPQTATNWLKGRRCRRRRLLLLLLLFLLLLLHLLRVLLLHLLRHLKLLVAHRPDDPLTFDQGGVTGGGGLTN